MDTIKRTKAEFCTFNLVLLDGQIGLEIDTRRTKTGNGNTPYLSLNYNGDNNDILIFNPIVGIKLDNISGNYYTIYTQSGVLEILFDSNSIIGGAAMLPIIVDGTTITVTGATKDSKSDEASTISGDIDRYVFWKDPIGIYYSITNLG